MLIKYIIKFKKMIYSIINKIFNKNIIVDVSGTILTPRNNGVNCKGNGRHYNRKNEPIECCCDECDYFMYCFRK